MLIMMSKSHPHRNQPPPSWRPNDEAEPSTPPQPPLQQPHHNRQPPWLKQSHLWVPQQPSHSQPQTNPPPSQPRLSQPPLPHPQRHPNTRVRERQHPPRLRGTSLSTSHSNPRHPI